MTERAHDQRFRRIAIVNRGEAAMRFIHAVRDYNAALGADASERRLTTIALFTDGERSAMFVREADETHGIGPAENRPYLDHETLAAALRATRAEAVWVGWGFVAEDAAFAELCDDLGVVFIGPSAESMRKLGDKIGSKLIAEEVGVPVAAWSRGGVDTLEQALSAAEHIGYPLMLKATAGGGGRGIRKVENSDQLADAYHRTRDEAERAFGSGIVFLERLVSGARHVEVQVIADGQGTAWAVGVRDCSIQRRNQKVIEESASALLTPAQTDDVKASAERLALAVDYKGAGTVEFLYQPEEGAFAFLEVNTRLQVEHPITEVTTGLDLVKLQLHVAQGGRLEGAKPAEFGHAVEARLNAEDPDRDFAPAPGHIERLDFPSGPGIRVDTGVAEGDTIPADFDSMIAKIIAWGATREEALARLRRAMMETTVVIDGGATNKSFILDLLDQPEVVSGTPQWADTGWIDRVRSAGRLANATHSGVALVVAGIEAYEDEEAIEIARLLETSHGGRPQVQHTVGRPVDLKLRGTTYQLVVVQTGPSRYRVSVSDGSASRTVDAFVDRIDAFHGRARVAGTTYRIVTATHGPVHLVEVDGVTHRVSRDEGGVLRSPAPALVVATPVAVGDEVASGAPVIVLESMKMETVLPAPFPGRVKEVLVSAGSQVETGTPLVRLEPTGETEEPAAVADTQSGPGLELPESSAGVDVLARAADLRAELSGQLMGFDVLPSTPDYALTSYVALRDDLRAGGVDVIADEIPLLDLFADMAELSRNSPAGEELHTELRVHSPREHFHTYLQSLDPERGGLPEKFRDRLAHALAHYGVDDTERTPALEEAVFRIFLATARHGRDVGIVTTLLERWMHEAPPSTDEHGSAIRAVLERLVRVTQRRFPAVGDLARSIRFRWFDQPLVDAERKAVLARVDGELDALSDDDAPDRQERMDALVRIPETLGGFVGERLRVGSLVTAPMLEVLVRRHYRDFDLHDVRTMVDGDRAYAVAEYSLEGRPTHLVATSGYADEFADRDSAVTGTIGALLAQRTTDDEAVVELYLSGDLGDDEATAARLHAVLGEQSWITQIRRVAVSFTPAQGPTTFYSYRWDEGQFVEDDRVRGVHPMVGRRLNLWRLREFDVTRVEAPDDVLLYECVARSNPSDRRLVAMAQVRQLAVVRDANGRVIGMPHAERAVENCLEAIRRVRTARGAGSFDTNHVWVTVWPLIEADPEQLTALQAKITPLSEGAGIEEVLAQGTFAGPNGSRIPIAIRFFAKPGVGVTASVEGPPTEPLKPIDAYAGKVLRARRRGLVYPYELSSALAGDGGSVVEHDLDEDGKLVPVERAPGQNTAGIITALVTTPTSLHPEGVRRIVLAGDPIKSLGSVAGPECARIIAALDLAEELRVPVEWYALSSGARISMDSGTENMDWVASALKRIVEFTQAGGEINVVVAGINVGAQPYWNAEATMLMHTRGILVMTPDSAMVLTGKQSLDFSGGVSAEDNYGIGGYDRVMGPNGQAQYWAPNLAGAIDVLVRHYEHTYVVPGESSPRWSSTSDPSDRDICLASHPGEEFATVGDIFSIEKNPDRKKAFDIRTVMRALADQDHDTLERWVGMADAETAVVFDARIGGHSVCLLGIESKPVPRRGFPPTDGPDTYTAGTLFPRSSKKAARAINSASGNRPLVVLANLSGFDGSPDSMRNLQLEYGAEIGRAIVNFRGPIVFCVISRYHGGAFVVFSKALNPRMTVLALEGSFASVIGGAPAAAVVFAGDVKKRVAADPRIVALQERIDSASNGERAVLLVELEDLRAAIRAEKIGEVAAEFDGVHNIHRAVEVGSVDAVISAARLRPEVIAALERS